MKILNTHIYRDGGTIMIETDKGKYWLPHHSIGVYKGDNYFRGVFELIDNEDEISILVKELARHSASYTWILRHVEHDIKAVPLTVDRPQPTPQQQP